MLRGQMSPWQMESVLNVHRNLPLKFHQNRVRNSWDIAKNPFFFQRGISALYLEFVNGPYFLQIGGGMCMCYLIFLDRPLQKRNVKVSLLSAMLGPTDQNNFIGRFAAVFVLYEKLIIIIQELINDSKMCNHFWNMLVFWLWSSKLWKITNHTFFSRH